MAKVRVKAARVTVKTATVAGLWAVGAMARVTMERVGA